ncbi:unnamed protein product [Cylindrotheca closterium]|uniref:Uncharacterized protein n=1 Tax=Cylindrotheca closterium TaxID=2856 RepID=A0AAD2FW63_9STRA|nr:unnamed protein product [Cylindrotheca closterium]
MWKPGTEQPTPRTPQVESPKNGAKEGKPSAEKPISSAKKRLSGATMNMRFMKRKKETDDYVEERRKSGVQSSPIPTPNEKQPTNPTPEATRTDKMDIDDDASTSDEFAQTTTLGLHGMDAMLIGRRSYGGFNPAVEDAWEKSIAAIENRSLEPSRKISDEELMRQYEAIVKERSGSSRPIGNLNGKKGKKKR